MKAHILIKVPLDAALPEALDWRTHIREPRSRRTSFTPSVDKVLLQHGCRVWVTREHCPHHARWGRDEIAAGLNRLYRLVLQREGGLSPELIRHIDSLPDVEYARVGHVGSSPLPQPHAAPFVARVSRWARDAVQLAEAHVLTRGHSEIKIAVLDTGVDLSHPELRGVLEPGYDFVDVISGAREFVGESLARDRETFIGDATVPDPQPDDEQGHGTHVAGIIAGRGERMPVGIAPRCKVIPVRVLATFRKTSGRVVGAGLVENINAGVKWAVDHGATVINMSLGIRHEGGGLPHAEVIDYAARKGVTVVAASGNDGREELYYPGALDHVIAVGSVGRQGTVSRFSTIGKQVDFVAPGEDILSSVVHGYDALSGTSQAAPFVAGAAALLRAYALELGRGALDDRQVKHLLKWSADRLGRALRTRQSGYGRINVADALRLLEHKRGRRAVRQTAA